MAIWNEELLDKEENIYKEAHLQKYWLKQKEKRENLMTQFCTWLHHTNQESFWLRGEAVLRHSK